MGFFPFPPSTITFQTIPNVLLLTYQTKKLNCPKWKQISPYIHVRALHKANTSSYSLSTVIGTPLIQVKCNGKNSGGTSDEDTEGKALDAVLRLYSAIKNRDLHELSDVIGEECRCMSNFILGFKPLHGKEQVMEFFNALMRVMGKHVEFVIQPTVDGTNVGLQWTLECSKTHTPLSKGFSFYTTHCYKGKMVISNVGMFMEPILHIEPLRLKLIGVLSQLVAQLGLHSLRKKKMSGYMLLFISLLLMAASIFFLALYCIN